METSSWTVISAIGAFAVAITMMINFFYIAWRDRITDNKRAEFDEDMLALKKIENKILINRNWMDLNKLIMDGDESLGQIIADKYFEQKIRASMVRRVYLCNLFLNNMEITWMLSENDLVDENIMGNSMKDQIENICRDKEALKIVLDGRGYPEKFKELVRSKAFPDDTSLQPV